MTCIMIPNKVKDALKDAKWTEAMNVEINALQKSGTWEIVSLLKEKKHVRCKWVYTVTHKVDGTILTDIK